MEWTSHFRGPRRHPGRRLYQADSQRARPVAGLCPYAGNNSSQGACELLWLHNKKPNNQVGESLTCFRPRSTWPNQANAYVRRPPTCTVESKAPPLGPAMPLTTAPMTGQGMLKFRG